MWKCAANDEMSCKHMNVNDAKTREHNNKNNCRKCCKEMLQSIKINLKLTKQMQKRCSYIQNITSINKMW